MLEDLLNEPVMLDVDGKNYKMEYDNRAYAAAERVVGKNIFSIYDSFFKTQSLSVEKIIELACCAMKKHHSQEEILEVKKTLQQNPSLWLKNRAAIAFAFLKPLLPQDYTQKTEDETDRKKS